MQEEISEAGHVTRTDPETAAPTGPAANRLDGFSFEHDLRVEVAVILPGVGSSDAIHDFLLEDERQRLLPNLQEGQRHAIDAHVVIFPKRSRFFDRARLPLAAAEFRDTYKVAVLSPHRTFPLAGLLQMFFPGDLRIMGRGISVIARVQFHWIVHALDQAAIYCQPTECGQKT